MKNLIKTLILSTLITGIASMQANPGLVSKLLSYAVQNYGFKIQYPISTQPGYMKRTQSPAHFMHFFDKSTLMPVSKHIIFDQEYFDTLAQKDDFKTLTAHTIHEHTHLDEDHAIILMRAMNDLNHTFNGSRIVDLNPGNTPAPLLALNRKLEERADAGLKRFPDLCLNQYHYFMKEGDREYKELQQEWLYEKDPAKRDLIAQVLSIFRSNNPELIKTIENATHPNPYRRALDFKQWADAK